jgi:hypothetical protein
VCGNFIEAKHYECSHIIDHCVGGPDEPFNLVAMCVFCNRMKPVHWSRSEYADWVRSFQDQIRRYVHALMGVQ